MDTLQEVVIEKLVHGGQGLGTLADGRKVFVWNGLPGETVRVEIKRTKKSWAEGVAREVLKPSSQRIEPAEAEYLATSPWQILDFNAENSYKADIIRELFSGEQIELPEFTVYSDGTEWGYRNKMEYSFYGDEEGVHLALHSRGTHQKMIVSGSKLAASSLDAAAVALVTELNRQNVRAGDLKSVIIRSSRSAVSAALYVKQKTFPSLALPVGLTGLRIVYSDPRSPASITTKVLNETGTTRLQDELLGKIFQYDVDSFFQVNIPVFERALQTIQEQCGSAEILDMYCGVGSIGLSVASGKLALVDIDKANTDMAKINAAGRPKTTIIHDSTEKVLEEIKSSMTVVLDPPRAGLHTKVVQHLTEVKPLKIIYLSCNPATQARDIKRLTEYYRIIYFGGYNFFPHTPHIETLAVLELL